MEKFKYTKAEIDEAIEQIVHDKRHRAVLLRRYNDREVLERLAELGLLSAFLLEENETRL